MSISLLIALFTFSYSCKEYDTTQQQLWGDVMVVHDEVMPKMGELHQLKKQLKKQTESPILQKTIQDIEQAQDAMMDWMREFKSLRTLSKLDQQVAIDYLKKEQARIGQIKKMMIESIEKGSALVQK